MLNKKDTIKPVRFLICFLAYAVIGAGMAGSLSAQNHTVLGHVLSSEDGEALSGSL